MLWLENKKRIKFERKYRKDLLNLLLMTNLPYDISIKAIESAIRDVLILTEQSFEENTNGLIRMYELNSPREEINKELEIIISLE